MVSSLSGGRRRRSRKLRRSKSRGGNFPFLRKKNSRRSSRKAKQWNKPQPFRLKKIKKNKNITTQPLRNSFRNLQRYFSMLGR
jgi:hypothetical protein